MAIIWMWFAPRMIMCLWFGPLGRGQVVDIQEVDYWGYVGSPKVLGEVGGIQVSCCLSIHFISLTSFVLLLLCYLLKDLYQS